MIEPFDAALIGADLEALGEIDDGIALHVAWWALYEGPESDKPSWQ